MRYYCNIRVDGFRNTSTKDDLFVEDVKELNNRMEELFVDWSTEMSNKGVITDIGWNWSEHSNL